MHLHLQVIILEKMGAKIIGASDSKGSILIAKGAKVSKLMEYKAKKWFCSWISWK